LRSKATLLKHPLKDSERFPENESVQPSAVMLQIFSLGFGHFDMLVEPLTRSLYPACWF
jgi:hypothetical protein